MISRSRSRWNRPVGGGSCGSRGPSLGNCLCMATACTLEISGAELPVQHLVDEIRDVVGREEVLHDRDGELVLGLAPLKVQRAKVARVREILQLNIQLRF